MHAKENAPSCWRSVGARKQDNFGKHPVPIVTRGVKRRKRKSRIRLRIADRDRFRKSMLLIGSFLIASGIALSVKPVCMLIVWFGGLFV